MSNNKAEKEELKKLEDEAYNELCQIIAEAMITQDIVLLDQRIVYWKKKYKKLLDSNTSASQNFKKRIEYLLNEYYSEITQYILKQIRKNEQKKLENQGKAMRKLRYIIDDTNDLSLLKKKVKEWEDKYPISGFLNMYQKRIKVYTSEKYLKEHSFDQEMAFHDLYYITKLSRTYDELKDEVEKWEDKYSINNKFKLDDFINHQSDINRYTSDEYLKSIAHADNSDNQDLILPEGKISDSSLSKQSAAYSSLISIAKKPNNINEIFDWVYKYNSIEFNDEYKNLILSNSAIYLDYSPTYLSTLSVPKINLSNSLSFEEYQKIDEIKKYVVISYFNLLLPPERRMSNNYFDEHIEKIYRKSKAARFSDEYIEADNILTKNSIDTDLHNQAPDLIIDIPNKQIISVAEDVIPEKSIIKNTDKTAQEKQVPTFVDTEEIQKKDNIKSTPATPEEPVKHIVTEELIIVEENPKHSNLDSLIEPPDMEEDKLEEDTTIKLIKEDSETLKPITKVPEKIVSIKDSEAKKVSSAEIDNTIKPLKLDSLSDTEIPVTLEEKPKETIATIANPKVVTLDKRPTKSQSDNLSISEKKPKIELSNEPQTVQEEHEDFTPDTIIAVSPLFFEIMNNKINTQKQQSTIVTVINTHVDDYITTNSNKTNDISITKINSN